VLDELRGGIRPIVADLQAEMMRHLQQSVSVYILGGGERLCYFNSERPLRPGDISGLSIDVRVTLSGDDGEERGGRALASPEAGVTPEELCVCGHPAWVHRHELKAGRITYCLVPGCCDEFRPAGVSAAECTATAPPLHRAPRDCRQSAENGGPGVTRTPGTQFRKLLLYPPELRGPKDLRGTDARF
jgi:hypothetical protein